MGGGDGLAMTTGQIVRLYGRSLVLWGAVGWLFYEHVVGVCLVALWGFHSARQSKQRFLQKRLQHTQAQFEQLLYSLTTSLQAGRSIENAFRAVEEDVRQTEGVDTPFLQQLSKMNQKVANAIPLEDALGAFDRALCVADISVWVDVFLSCKRTGGDLVHVMRHTSRVLVENMGREREMAVLLAAKKLEARWLAFLPFVFVALFRYGSPEYMAPLYTGKGALVMTVCLCALLFAQTIAHRMMQGTAERPTKNTSVVPFGKRQGMWYTLVLRTGLYRYISRTFPIVARYCRILDVAEKDDPSVAWIAQGTAYVVALWIVAVVTWVGTADAYVGGLLGGCALLFPYVWWKQLVRNVQRKREHIVEQLPVFIHKFALLLQAGDPLVHAWQRASDCPAALLRHPLYASLAHMQVLLRQAVAFPRALDVLQRQCSTSEMSAFVTTVLMNYHRGGATFVAALFETMRTLTDRKQALLRTKAEEASTKLIFPMLLMVAVVMGMMAAPAVWMMNTMS